MKIGKILTSIACSTTALLSCCPIMTSCSKLKKLPMIAPSAEEVNKTIPTGKKGVDFTFKFSSAVKSDDIKIHIKEEALSSLIAIDQSTIVFSSDWKQLTLTIYYWNKPTQDITTNFTLQFEYYTGDVKEVACSIKYVHEVTKCTVNFMIGSEIFKTQEVNYGETVSNPGTPTTPGGTFRGWFLDEGYETPWNFETFKILKASTNIYGVFDFETYTVKFNLNGGNGTTPNDQKATYGTSITDPCGDHPTIPTPQKTHYTYQGWSINESGEPLWDFTTDKVTSNMTLYVSWKPVTYLVHFYVNKLSWKTVSVCYNTPCADPEYEVPEGHVFNGWYANETCTGEKWNFNDPITDSINLYATDITPELN